MVGDGLRLLLVDDEPDLLAMASIQLRRMGYEVTPCDSATSALSLFEERDFDAVISDYEMPGMDGIELLSRIREIDKRLPFILFTGRGREEVAIEALNEGANYYIQKGIGFNDIFNEMSVQVNRFVNASRDSSNFDCLLSSIDDMILVVEGDVIVWANNVSGRVLGMPSDSIVGTPVEGVIPRDVIELGSRLEGAVRHDLLSGGSRTVESSFTRGRWDGKDVTVVVSRDRSLELIAERTLNHVFDHVSMVNEIRLRAGIDRDAWIDGLISILGESQGVDRAYLFSIDPDAGHMSNTYEWCAEGISPQIDNLQEFPLSESGWWIENLGKGIIMIPWVPDIEDDTTREVLMSQDIKSLLVVPLSDRSGLRGFLGFDSVRGRRTWSTADLYLLREIARLITIAVDATIISDG